MVAAQACQALTIPPALQIGRRLHLPRSSYNVENRPTHRDPSNIKRTEDDATSLTGTAEWHTVQYSDLQRLGQ